MANNLDVPITDAGVIEQIRAALPVATVDKAGLADKMLLKAFQMKRIYLNQNEETKIGPVSGFLEIRIPSWSSLTALYYIDNYSNKAYRISGVGDRTDVPIEFIWSNIGDSYYNELKVKNTFVMGSYFYITWQEIGHAGF